MRRFHEQAVFIRQVSNSSELEEILLKAIKILSIYKIPHYVCGGYAVQERGYPRFTQDLEIIVPNTRRTQEKLNENGFNKESGNVVSDHGTGVWIVIREAGEKAGRGAVAYPKPTKVSDKPKILSLKDLLSLNLSTYKASPVHRAKDYGDAVELIKANKPERTLAVNSKVQYLYRKTWDELFKENVKTSLS